MKWRFLFALALLCFTALSAAQPLRRQGEPDWTAIAGSYPQLGSLPSQEELAIMHWLQDTRTRADAARAGVESRPDLGGFLAALGWCPDPSAYPDSAALLNQAAHDMKPIVKALKAGFGRVRPYLVDPTLVPALPGDGTLSFPSKHAFEGTLFAALLAQLDPGDQGTLLEQGKRIGDDRVMAGLHWPSDVLAGQRLGNAFAAYWLGLPENQQLIQDAAREWAQPQGAFQVPGRSKPLISR